MFVDNPFKNRMPHDDEYLAGRHLPVFAGGAHAVLGTELLPPFPGTMQQIIFGLGCFGVPNGFSGQCPECMSPRLAMPVGAHRTRPMKRFVPGELAIAKWCWWCLTQKKSSLANYCKLFGKRMTPPKAIVRAMTEARNIVRLFSHLILPSLTR